MFDRIPSLKTLGMIMNAIKVMKKIKKATTELKITTIYSRLVTIFANRKRKASHTGLDLLDLSRFTKAL